MECSFSRSTCFELEIPWDGKAVRLGNVDMSPNSVYLAADSTSAGRVDDVPPTSGSSKYVWADSGNKIRINRETLHFQWEKNTYRYGRWLTTKWVFAQSNATLTRARDNGACITSHEDRDIVNRA